MGDIPLIYELSQEADNDLSQIYDYTIEKFGTSQAIEYLTSFEQVFQSLCSNPKLGRKRDEIRKRVRSFSNESHVVFYTILEDRIRIIRVLHASRDITSFPY